MKQSPNKHHDGSILLETVIVLPLFMILIGGIMWSGQLIYDKQKLVIADRYVAWNVGNRHNQSFRSGDVAGAVQKAFFVDKDHDAVTPVFPASSAVTKWWWESYAGVDLNVTMPSWTLGWFAAHAALHGTELPETLVHLHGRDIKPGPSGGYEGHVVIMRSTLAENTPYTTRYNNGEILNPDKPLKIDCKSLFGGEPWPGK